LKNQKNKLSCIIKHTEVRFHIMVCVLIPISVPQQAKGRTLTKIWARNNTQFKFIRVMKKIKFGTTIHIALENSIAIFGHSFIMNSCSRNWIFYSKFHYIFIRFLL